MKITSAALTHGAVTQRLGQMTLAGAAGPCGQHCDPLVEIAPGGQILDQRAVEPGQPGEVELLDGFLRAEGRTAQPGLQLLLLAAGDFVGDQQREKLGVSELAVDGLAITGFQRVEDAGQAQLLEMRGELGNGIHGRVSISA
nr:hypothetical protein [Sinimarinibacterium flocculans]